MVSRVLFAFHQAASEFNANVYLTSAALAHCFPCLIAYIKASAGIVVDFFDMKGLHNVH